MIAPKPQRRSGVYVLATFVVLLFLYLHHMLPAYTFSNRSRRPASTGRSTEGEASIDDVYNTTLGFEKVFVVGLPERSDRRDGMTLQAAVSDIDIEFIDGVRGTEIPDKAVPTSKDHGRPPDPVLGAWRGHMNAIREVVRRNLSSALILEDDTDWDVRFKDQLHDFALATRTLTQPLSNTPSLYADPTFPIPRKDHIPITVPDFDFHQLPFTTPPSHSPYGDDWDLLWLGQCAMRFPTPEHPQIPKARIIKLDDPTVPEPRYMWSFTNPFSLVEDYPPHTRVYHHAQEGVCALGYAISQRGARKLLQEIALKDVSDAVDILLRFFCDGERGRNKGVCLTTQPGIVQHHRPPGPDRANSDIGDHGDGWRERGMTDMVRWSVRMNVERMLEAEGEMWEQFPDSEPVVGELFEA